MRTQIQLSMSSRENKEGQKLNGTYQFLFITVQVNLLSKKYNIKKIQKLYWTLEKRPVYMKVQRNLWMF
jgi:hypothetical protein